MSVNRTPASCQALRQLLTSTLEPFITHIRETIQNTSTPAALTLSPDVLALVAAYWQTKASAKIVVLDHTASQSDAWRALVAAWETFWNRGHHWHVLNHSMSPEELSGQVTTSLSLAYHYLLQGERGDHHFIIPASAQELLLPDAAAYQAQAIILHVGERATLQELTRAFTEQGYIRYTDSLESGGIRVRGEHIDIRHPTMAGPVTVTLYGNVIESIITAHGRRSANQTVLKIPPMAFPAATAPVSEAVRAALIFRPQHLAEWHGAQTIIHDAVQPIADTPWHAEVSPTLTPATTVFALYQNRDRLEHYFNDHSTNVQEWCHSQLAQYSFALTNNAAMVVTEAKLLPEAPTEQPLRYEEGLALLAELTEGKPAVHSDHGIALYEGLQRRAINGVEREYLVLRYAEGDMLSVPVEFAYKVTAYVGETSPPLHRLGGTAWIKTRRQAREAAQDLAKELLATARQRERESGDAFYIDPALETALEQSFPYTLTPDQEAAWHAIQHDLQQATPMDRLVVGDVGFGKTEVAIRAARHVLANNRQVAVLAPTTLLVQQHADTFRQRLGDVAAQIGTLSRFSSATEQRNIRRHIAAGEVGIAVGTHALLSSATTWHNLGLVIIDEEQRFGVTHKEHFKKIRANVDVLSLSATPIPRTLSMALSGLKKLSIISTPPAGRKSVQTHVGQETDALLKEALSRELERGGQAYVVSPTIRGLAALTHRLKKLLPAARIAFAHGQMPNQQLSRIIEQFDTGAIDVLVSSTIVENGLDLPNVNTLIVTRATHLGLGELYQLRGRVGRRERQGYAYFLYTQDNLTMVQRQRLSALIETTRLGSGWTLAQRDLEIRGAGNLLGAEQSGSVNAVGVQLYLDMVQDAVHDTDHLARRDVEITLPLPALLPTHYIADLAQRTHYYHVLSRAQTPEALRQHTEKIVRAYGPLPSEVTNLILLLQLQHAAAANAIQRITSMTIAPPDEDPYARLQIAGRDVLRLLQQLQPLGNWEVRGELLTLDVAEITPDLINQLTQALTHPFSHP